MALNIMRLKKTFIGGHLFLVLMLAITIALLNANSAIHSSIVEVDTFIAFKLNSLLGLYPFLDETFAWLSTRLGDFFVLSCFFMIFIMHSVFANEHAETIKRLSYWLWSGLLCVSMYLISCITEYFIRRDTPIYTLQHFNNLQTSYGIMLHSCPTSCFPSGHALAYIFFAIMAWRKYPKMGIFISCVGIIMLTIRLAVGLHWLSDILIGSLLFASMLIALIIDTPLKNTYYLCESFVSFVLDKTTSRFVIPRFLLSIRK